ncbi:unnamed protein product, partial [Nesidiocoris tenuis]
MAIVSCSSLTLVVVDVVAAVRLEANAAIGASPAVRALACVLAFLQDAGPMSAASVGTSSWEKKLRKSG